MFKYKCARRNSLEVLVKLQGGSNRCSQFLRPFFYIYSFRIAFCQHMSILIEYEIIAI